LVVQSRLVLRLPLTLTLQLCLGIVGSLSSAGLGRRSWLERGGAGSSSMFDAMMAAVKSMVTIPCVDERAQRRPALGSLR
jgi:Mg/Co/Ni transporter MgtE